MRAKSNSYSEVQQTIDRQLADIQADNQRAAETDVAGRETVKPKYSLINKLKNMMKKKTLMMLLVLLMAAVGAKAQTHWTLTHDENEGHSTETPVYGKLDLGGATVLPENYEIAAFIDDEVRAVVTCKRTVGGDAQNLFELVVRGNYDQAASADDGKDITFKLFNVMTGLEYDLTVSSTVTFDGNWHGISSMPLTFSVVEVQTLSLADFEMNVGQTVDLMTMLVKDPANATMPNGITWSVTGFENYLSITADGKLTANAVGENLMVNFSYGQGNMGSATVTVKNPATAITVKSGYETIIVNVGDATTLTQKLSEAIQMTPADATDRVMWTSSDEDVVAENMTNAQWNPVAKGTATMTATVIGNAQLTAQLTVRVVESLTSFAVTIPSPLIAGTTAQIVVTPQPDGADYDMNSLTWQLTDSSLPTGWKLIDVTGTSKDNSGNVVYTVSAENPGTANFRVMYDDGVTQINSDPQIVNVAVALTLQSGWQWMTPWKDIESANMTKAFGVNLVEIRSQEALMANDATYGYWGTLADNGLMANHAYKVNMSAAVAAGEAYLMENGSPLMRSMEQQLKKSWTWIPYPYYHSYPISALEIYGATGDRIVSFANGFAEYNGTAWTGTLTELNPREAYLYYNNSGAVSSFKWNDEPTLFNMQQAAPSRQLAKKVVRQSVWQYDPSRFSDNMSMVAEVNEQVAMNGEQWSVGAFVGNECRGEGRLVDGKFFITVHANQGEMVNFRLHNSISGEEYRINETVPMRLMLGSLRAPFQLTTDGADTTTGISTMDNGQKAMDKCYDLSGRRVNAKAKGLYIVDGKKVVK